MFSRLSDPAFPALASLGPVDLARITGAPEARLLRLRYQPGARAMPHVSLGPGGGPPEGAIWFFAGDKARKLARRAKGARRDVPTQALFQAFPQDHRMPALATFVDGAIDLAPALIGGLAASPPVLMRYRPGLSATFRWMRQDGRIFFVKQTPDSDVRVLALVAGQLADALRGTQLGVVPGRPLDAILESAPDRDVRDAIAQITGALRTLWSQTLVPVRLLSRSDHLLRGAQASQIIALADEVAGQQAAGLLRRLENTQAPVRLRPIHADMKLEHAFLSGPMTTLIDTESLSLGDPEYDLAKLEMRLVMAQALGGIAPARAQVAVAEVRRDAGQHYDWFLTCARLQCASFFAQRLNPATIPLMRLMLTPC